MITRFVIMHVVPAFKMATLIDSTLYLTASHTM